MNNLYDRIVWTLIAAALVVIAMNPWIAPGILNAQSDVVKVDIVRIGGGRNIVPSRRTIDALPVIVVE